MPKSTNYADNLFKLFNTNLAYAGIGDAPGLQPSATPGSLYVSLHTGDPGLSGSQSVNEAGYTGYNRVAVPRSALGWAVSTNQVTNVASITFGTCLGSSALVTWFGIGTDATGAGQLLYAFPLIQAYSAFFATPVGNLFYQASGLPTLTAIQFMTAPGGVLPAPVAQGTTYYVGTVGTNVFTVSLTSGGADLPLATVGTGLLGQIASLSVTVGISPQFLAGQLVISEV